MKIDETYLSVHPATQVWWDLEPACADCIHLRRGNDMGLRCARSSGGPSGQASRWDAGRKTRKILDYCIDVRSADGACGPIAKLFKRV